MIAVGADAPDFELPSSLPTDAGKPGKKVRLSDYRGKQAVVLAFYPLDFSPVCSGEMACFKDDIGSLRSAHAEVVGVSVDSAWTHAAFAKQLGFDFPLVADFHPKGEMADKYGLYEADKGFTSRATVIVDKAGKVAYAKNHGLGTPRDNKEILAELAKLAGLDFFAPLVRQTRKQAPPACTVSLPATRLVRTSSTAPSAQAARARCGRPTTRPSPARWR